MGVCAAITPYNFPLTLLGTKVAPALACGNTVVAKPASTTPLATLEVARLFAEAGVPDGVLNVVTGRGSVIGDALVGHPTSAASRSRARRRSGATSCRSPAPQMKRLTLELGGSDPVIVCEDADVDAAVKAVIIGRYWNAGQACLGCKRVYVHDVGLRRLRRRSSSTASAATSRATAREGREAAAAHGPDPHARRAATSWSSSSRTASPRAARCSSAAAPTATTRAGSWSPRSSPSPATDSRLVREEVFGPVLPVFRYTDFDDALRRANDTPYGLGSSIWTHDVRMIHRAAQEIDAGMTWVNQIHYGYDELPFGGDEGLRVRQGARPGGDGQLRRAQERRRRRARLMAVTYEADGAIGTITLDNPPANSYDIELMREFADAIDEAIADDGRPRRGRAQREREVLLRGRRRQEVPRRATSTRTWR